MLIKILLLITSIILSQLTYSQNNTSIHIQAYKAAYGIEPNRTEVARLNKIKGIELNSYKGTLQYFNKEIFRNRETVQRDIIKRAYISVLKRKPTNEEVEEYYAATTNKSKNYTELCSEIRSYFKSEIDYPE